MSTHHIPGTVLGPENTVVTTMVMVLPSWSLQPRDCSSEHESAGPPSSLGSASPKGLVYTKMKICLYIMLKLLNLTMFILCHCNFLPTMLKRYFHMSFICLIYIILKQHLVLFIIKPAPLSPGHSPQALTLKTFWQGSVGLLSAYGTQKCVYPGIASCERCIVASWQLPERANSFLLLCGCFSLPEFNLLGQIPSWTSKQWTNYSGVGSIPQHVSKLFPGLPSRGCGSSCWVELCPHALSW